MPLVPPCTAALCRSLWCWSFPVHASTDRRDRTVLAPEHFCRQALNRLPFLTITSTHLPGFMASLLSLIAFLLVLSSACLPSFYSPSHACILGKKKTKSGWTGWTVVWGRGGKRQGRTGMPLGRRTGQDGGGEDSGRRDSTGMHVLPALPLAFLCCYLHSIPSPSLPNLHCLCSPATTTLTFPRTLSFTAFASLDEPG